MKSRNIVTIILAFILLVNDRGAAQDSLQKSVKPLGFSKNTPVAKALIEVWLEKDLDSLDEVLERGEDLYSPLDTSLIPGHLDLEFVEPMCFMELALANIWYFPEAYEVVLRYATKEVANNKSGKYPAHNLAESSRGFPFATAHIVPNVYFTDLYILALNGFSINKSDLGSNTPFGLMTQRIIQADVNRHVTDSRLVRLLNTFHSCSIATDSLKASDIALVTEYMKDDAPVRSIASERIRLGFYKDTLKHLEPLAPNSFSTVWRSSTNYWFLDIVWPNSCQREYAEVFTLGKVLDRSEPEEASDKIRSCIRDGTNVTQDGVSLLMQAYACRHNAELRKLLESGESPEVVLRRDLNEFVLDKVRIISNPTFCPRTGDTILLCASLDPFRKLEVLPLMLQYSSAPDARDLLNRNPLHRFLYHRVQDEQKHLLKLLVSAGVDVNAKSVSGNTPCHVAVNRNGHLIVDMIESGADLYMENDLGQTPVDLLKRSVDEKWIFHEQNARVLAELSSKGLLKGQ